MPAATIAPPAPATAGAHHHNNLDLIRLLLALAVIYSHCFALATGTGNDEPVQRLTRGHVTLGDLAVDCFFIVSGFLVTRSDLTSRSVTAYLAKRCLRILPGYWAAVAVCVGVVSPLESPPRHPSENFPPPTPLTHRLALPLLPTVHPKRSNPHDRRSQPARRVSQ